MYLDWKGISFLEKPWQPKKKTKILKITNSMSTEWTHVYVTQSVWKNIARKKQASEVKHIFFYPGIDEILSKKELQNLGNQEYIGKLLQNSWVKLSEKIENIKVTSNSHQKMELWRFHVNKDCEAMQSDFRWYYIKGTRKEKTVRDKKIDLDKQYNLWSLSLWEALKVLSQEFWDTFYCLDIHTNEQIKINQDKRLDDLDKQISDILDNELKKDIQKYYPQIEKLFNNETDSSINQMMNYFQEKWNLTVAETTFEIIEKPNSGIWDHEIETLESATKELDEKIKDIYIYVRNNITDQNKYIFNKLKFHTYIFKNGNKDNVELPKNFHYDKKLQDILRNLSHEEYKIFNNYDAKVNNVKAAVDTYIRMKVNPDLLIEGENAKKLGLIACSKCKNQ